MYLSVKARRTASSSGSIPVFVIVASSAPAASGESAVREADLALAERNERYAG